MMRRYLADHLIRYLDRMKVPSTQFTINKSLKFQFLLPFSMNRSMLSGIATTEVTNVVNDWANTVATLGYLGKIEVTKQNEMDRI